MKEIIEKCKDKELHQTLKELYGELWPIELYRIFLDEVRATNYVRIK